MWIPKFLAVLRLPLRPRQREIETGQIMNAHELGDMNSDPRIRVAIEHIAPTTNAVLWLTNRELVAYSGSGTLWFDT